MQCMGLKFERLAIAFKPDGRSHREAVMPGISEKKAPHFSTSLRSLSLRTSACKSRMLTTAASTSNSITPISNGSRRGARPKSYSRSGSRSARL